jgi:hypothetical protein
VRGFIRTSKINIPNIPFQQKRRTRYMATLMARRSFVKMYASDIKGRGWEMPGAVYEKSKH